MSGLDRRKFLTGAGAAAAALGAGVPESSVQLTALQCSRSPRLPCLRFPKTPSSEFRLMRLVSG